MPPIRTSEELARIKAWRERLEWRPAAGAPSLDALTSDELTLVRLLSEGASESAICARLDIPEPHDINLPVAIFALLTKTGFESTVDLLCAFLNRRGVRQMSILKQ